MDKDFLNITAVVFTFVLAFMAGAAVLETAYGVLIMFAAISYGAKHKGGITLGFMSALCLQGVFTFIFTAFTVTEQENVLRIAIGVFSFFVIWANIVINYYIESNRDEKTY